MIISCNQGARRQPQRCRPDLLRGCCLNDIHWQLRSASPFPSARPGAMATLEDISMTLADGSTLVFNECESAYFQKKGTESFGILWNPLSHLP